MGDVEYDVAADPATRITRTVPKAGGSFVVCCITPPSFEFGDARALGCCWIRGLAGKVGETAFVRAYVEYWVIGKMGTYARWVLCVSVYVGWRYGIEGD